MGPLTRSEFPWVHCSPFGVIPKKEADTWRLIVDLSSPKGKSVNDGIREELSSISYVTIDMVVDKVLELGEGALMAKTDVKSAFRIIPMRPTDRWLLGMEWKGNLYIDKVLPFGLKSTPKIFNAVADAIQFAGLTQGIQWIVHYSDDYLILGAHLEQCQQALEILQGVCQDMGIPLAPDKTHGSSTQLEFLGIGFDMQKLQLQLPERKRVALLWLVKELASRKSATKLKLQSLAGKLIYAAKVVRPRRCFTRSTYELASIRECPSDKIRLTQDFRVDLSWWALLLEQWNGTSLLWNHISRFSRHSGLQ